MGALLEQLQGRRGYMKLTWDDLADRVHKDVSTVKKQISLSANPSLATLEEYAAAMDAEIVLLSGDALADYHNSGIARAQKNMADMDREIEALKEKVKEREETIAILRDKNGALQADVDMLIKSNNSLTSTNNQLVFMLKEKG